jgi:hypothetical protein
MKCILTFILSSSSNICRFKFFTPTLIFHLIKKNKVIKTKYILKLYYVINYIIFKIYNNYKFYFK